MPLGINLFGKGHTQEAQKESAKEMVREWQRNLRAEARGLDRSIRKIEQEEDKIRKDIQTMAKQGGDPKSIQMLAKSLVRSNKAKDRLYTSRSIMQSAVAELETTAATMRLSDSMSKSAEVMKQMNSLVKIPEMEESISSMKREMMRAGLIDELIDEGMEEMDGPDLEVEAEAEVDKVLDWKLFILSLGRKEQQLRQQVMPDESGVRMSLVDRLLARLACFSEAEACTLELPVLPGQVQLVGFSGDQTNYNESAPHMRWTGHVGLRFSDAPKVMFGFTPDTELRNDMRALVGSLLEGNSFPGKVSDDFQDFEDAALSPHGVIFVFWDVQGACNEKDCGLSSILKDMDDINKVYAFPPEAPQKYRGKAYSACNSTWGALCFNCATYPKSVGLPIPEDTGMLPGYLEKMALLHGSFCRCYKSGRWRPKSDCWAERHRLLFESCAFEQPVEDL
ncbi:chmp3 [Symbiodinium pilosum]|uniref:Chmp3 protein n=1 Tax=Symbiodinium pilosum TaxID=2952 RepID=A0A812XUY3_SYMPI|nr:chmp3 [Symbiodinium pilosum]